MNKRELRDWLPFAREVASGPARSTSLIAAFLLKKYAEKRKPMPKRKIEKQAKAAFRKGARADVRAACVARANGLCEACGAEHTPLSPLEMDHFEGRARSEAVETCWMLCRHSHRAKTENYPSREFWDRRFADHCRRHGYPPPRKRLTKNLARSSLKRSDSTDMGSVGLVTGGVSLSTESK